MNKMKAVVLIIFSLIAFAGNSILSRIALGSGEIDAASFTSIRLLSGIALLLVLNNAFEKNNKKDNKKSKGSWKSSFSLFIYAVTFSYAYIYLDTGTGALVLFASVQVALLLINYYLGFKVCTAEWLGIITAFMGFLYLVWPELSTPSFIGFILMSISGVAWAVYTFLGKSSIYPLRETTYNFLRTLPFVFLLIPFAFDASYFSIKGIYLAVIAGSLTSGVGYAIWYQSLKYISVFEASLLQLLVPAIAAIGGLILVGENLSMRLLLSSIIILGGITVAIVGKHFFGQVVQTKT